MHLFKISLFTLFFLLTACTSTTGYQQKINKWQGKNIQTLIDKWGQPDAGIQLANGNKIYQYTRKTTYSIPDPKRTPLCINNKNLISDYAEPWNTNLTHIRYCQTSFETMPDGHIIHISFKGDNCVANHLIH